MECTPWISTNLSETGMMDFFLNNELYNMIDDKAFQRMCDIFHQDVFAEKTEGKRQIKNIYRDIKKQQQDLKATCAHKNNTRVRIHFSKLRLSNHQLMIEKGRHLLLEKHKAEDESHCLVECKFFTNNRNELFTAVSREIRNFSSLNKTEYSYP